MQRLISRALFCLFALSLTFSVFTSNAALQTNASTNTAVVVNANVAPRRSPTPRVSARRSNQAVTSNLSNAELYTPVPTPTPPANSTLRGRVYYADTGRAVKRASLLLMNEIDDAPSSTPSAITDNEGSFQVKNVRAGTYYAMINAPGVVSPMAYLDFSALRSGQGERESMAKAFRHFEKIVVDGVTDLDVQIPARRGGAIGGRIMYDDGDPAIGVKVEILRKVEDKFIFVIPNFSTLFSMRTSSLFMTDDRGVYRFPGLPPGEYIVKVTESASHSEERGKRYFDPFEMGLGSRSLLTIFYPDVFDTKAAQIINVDYGQELSEINLTIPSRQLFKLEGKIVSRKDKSPVKARVTLTREGTDRIYSISDSPGRRQEPSATDEKGVWKFKELPKGAYRILIEPVANENEYQAALGNYSNINAAVNGERNSVQTQKFAQKALEIILEDKDMTEIVVELGDGAIVSGTVAVENSQELPERVTIQAVSVEGELNVSDSVFNSRQEFYPSNSNQSGVVRSSKSDREFKLENVVEGKNYLRVSVEDKDYYVKSATLGGVDLLAAPFEIKDGDTWRNVQIVLGKDAGTLKGKLLDEEREPIRGALLMLVPTDGRRKNSSFYRQTISNESGEFEAKLAPGEYVVVFSDQLSGELKFEEYFKKLDELIKQAQTVKIEAGRTESLTVNRKK